GWRLGGRDSQLFYCRRVAASGACLLGRTVGCLLAASGLLRALSVARLACRLARADGSLLDSPRSTAAPTVVVDRSRGACRAVMLAALKWHSAGAFSCSHRVAVVCTPGALALQPGAGWRNGDRDCAHHDSQLDNLSPLHSAHGCQRAEPGARDRRV